MTEHEPSIENATSNPPPKHSMPHHPQSGLKFILTQSLYFLTWSTLGLSIGVVLVLNLSDGWSDAAPIGADLSDPPAGIVLAGSFGSLIATVLCGILGPFFVAPYYIKRWGYKAAVLSGFLGPGLAVTGGLVGMSSTAPLAGFPGILIGLGLGSYLGKRLGTLTQPKE